MNLPDNTDWIDVARFFPRKQTWLSFAVMGSDGKSLARSRNGEFLVGRSSCFHDLSSLLGTQKVTRFEVGFDLPGLFWTKKSDLL